MVHYQLSARSYAKLLCHAAKYPDRAVNGVLIGTISKKDHCVQVQDAIPLFHLEHSITPLLEVALSQVELYSNSKGLSIVGYYHANELIDDISINDTASSIGRKIVNNCDTACLLMVCNDTILLQDTSISLKMYTYNDSTGNWKEQKELSVINSDNTVLGCKRLITNGVYKKLIDFDSHLETVSDDWANPDINKAVETFQ